ncbi:hypothetical protein ACFY9N_03350 [Microbacterium sp. NPDC008134]|uniref:hypothetical protein n=1 Tax=Microbacterium sp. NPDC008134 TaxID=3364183 RepID=UPI0036E1E436
MHSSEEILRAAAEWAWFPRGSESESAELLLVRYPRRFGGGVRGSQVHSSLSAAEVVDRAIARTALWEEDVLTFWTNPSDGPDLEDELRRRGAEHIDTVAVFAAPIDSTTIHPPADTTVEVVTTLPQIREVDAINVAVWEQLPLDESGLSEELDEVAGSLVAKSHGRVLARIEGRAVSTGGVTLADGFARLWGAATFQGQRGRGAYRAVLAERLRLAQSWGAETALVKGRISTSAPILRRSGFAHYGDERAYRLVVR